MSFPREPSKQPREQNKKLAGFAAVLHIFEEKSIGYASPTGWDTGGLIRLGPAE
jgi:hypothetical protein